MNERPVPRPQEEPARKNDVPWRNPSPEPEPTNEPAQSS